MAHGKVKYIFTMVEMSKLAVFDGYKVLPPAEEGSHPFVFDGNESIYLKNRSSIDISSDYLTKMTSMIEDTITMSDKPIEILDVGGGYNSVLAREIALEHGDNVRTTNLDVVLNTNVMKPNNFRAILGDVLNMRDIPSEHVDFLYSYKLLLWFRFKEDGRLHRALSEIARVLQPNRSAFLDMGIGYDMLSAEKFYKENKWNVKIELGQYNEKKTPITYMVMKKN